MWELTDYTERPRARGLVRDGDGFLASTVLFKVLLSWQLGCPCQHPGQKYPRTACRRIAQTHIEKETKRTRQGRKGEKRKETQTHKEQQT